MRGVGGWGVGGGEVDEKYRKKERRGRLNKKGSRLERERQRDREKERDRDSETEREP